MLSRCPDEVTSRRDAFALWKHLHDREVAFELDSDPSEWVDLRGRPALSVKEVARFRRLVAEVDRLGAEAFDCYADARRMAAQVEWEAQSLRAA